MRSLPNLANANQTWRPTVQLQILASDQSTTFIHCSHGVEGIHSMPDPLEWVGPFAGGLGLPSPYKINLSFPHSGGLGIIKQRLPLYLGGTATLQVDVASHTFYPHVGRVRGAARDGHDPNLLTLTILDRFTDDAPMVPKTAIVDSYSTVHMEDQNKGYPLYYGEENVVLGGRPFYFTATDCNISVLLGPRNVTSASHVTSLWVNANVQTRSQMGQVVEAYGSMPSIMRWSYGAFYRATHPQVSVAMGEALASNKSNVLFNKAWAQQSGSTNAASGGYPFEVRDVSESDIRLYQWGGNLLEDALSVHSLGSIVFYNEGKVNIIGNYAFGAASQTLFHGKVPIVPAINLSFANITRLAGSVTEAGISANSVTQLLGRLYYLAGTSSYLNSFVNTVGVSACSVSGPVDVSSTGLFGLNPDGKGVIFLEMTAAKNNDLGATGYLEGTLQLHAQLASEAYRAYSIWACFSDASASRIAISENPMTILAHVNCMEVNLPIVTSQCSAAQLAVTSYWFSSLFHERRPARSVFDEFGQITGVGMWLGDSGCLNFRTYAESATATINRTLTQDDFLLDGSGRRTFTIEDRPIGSGEMRQALLSDLTVQYGFSFHRRLFESNLRAFPANNAMCNSLQAAGIRQAGAFATEHIMATATASYWLGNLVRKHSQGGSFIGGRLGPRHLDLELNDVLRVQDPLIVGSASTYQITRLAMHPLEGWVEFTAQELQTLT